MQKKVRNIISYIGAFLIVFGLLNMFIEYIQNAGVRFNNIMFGVSKIATFLLSAMFVHFFFIPPCNDRK